MHPATGQTTWDKPDLSGLTWSDELVAPGPPAAPDEDEDEPREERASGSDSDSDLTPIDGVAFADAAGWMTTRTHAMIHGHNDGSSFKTIAIEIERVYEVKLSKIWRKRLKKLFLR